MATATRTRRGKELDHQLTSTRRKLAKQHAARIKQGLADELAELQALRNQAGSAAIAVRPQERFSAPLAPMPPIQRDFHSAQDAKPMRRSDIANVQFLSLDDARLILKDVAALEPMLAAKAIAKVNTDWGLLLNEQERFTLSAMAARKLLREKRAAK